MDEIRCNCPESEGGKIHSSACFLRNFVTDANTAAMSHSDVLNAR